LRVVVAMRSDFLDRAAEDPRFVEELSRGLQFLRPLSRDGLSEALSAPLSMLGYGFEPGIVDAMLDALDVTPGALPLLQFTATKLWEQRDKQRRVITQSSYLATGGVAGALATHANEVLAAFAPGDQKLVRVIFQRLVTPERTRAIVERGEMRQIAADVDRIVARLVEARLLIVQQRGEGEHAIELVHESLITRWPTLQRWLDEDHEDAAYLAQVRAAATQWEQKGRPQGLLWRGEAMEEARLWRSRYRGELAPREAAYLTAVFALATRGRRRARAIALGVIAFLSVAVVAGAFLLQRATDARQDAENTLRKLVKAQGDVDKANADVRAAHQRAADANATADKAVAAAAAREREAKQAEADARQRAEEASAQTAQAEKAQTYAQRVAKDTEKRAKDNEDKIKKGKETLKHEDENRSIITNDLAK
jgi:hypothetical protein